jgi:dTDP-4-dehydrorhamnose 3,5-epimerase
MKLTFTPQAIPEVMVVEHERIGDSRGFFAETWREDQFQERGLPRFVQDNLSRSAKGVLRGLHFQKRPDAIGKLVRCSRGRIFDVAVDIRRGSPTFARYVTVELDEDSGRMLWVPEGFAHGFCVLSESADVQYKVTGTFSPACDCGIRWNDPQIGVPWPIQPPTLSARDQKSPLLAESQDLFTYERR